MTEIQIQNIFQQQRLYRWETKQWSVDHRLTLLKLLRDAIKAQQDEICQCLSADFQKPEVESWLTEIYPVLSEIKLTLGQLKKWAGKKKVAAGPLLLGSSNWIQSEPRGTVLIISPWNYPFSLAMMPLISSIAAGNTAILKPSELTPRTSALLEKILSEVFDSHYIAVVQGDKEISQTLLKLPFDHIFFTGSTQVGKIVMRAASEHLSSLTLELGGKSPVIVHSSCDLALAAQKIIWGKLINAGQTCIAPDYLLVEDSIQQEFQQHLQKALAEMEAGDSQAAIITQAHWDRLQRLSGNALATPAAPAANKKFPLQILPHPEQKSPLMSEEIFGPLLPILPFKTLEDAIQIIQAGAKPLALYIFAKDSSVWEKILQQTTSGGVCINETLLHFANPRLPFGGIGESGMGNYHGEFGFLAMSHQRAIFKQGLFGKMITNFYPPYNRSKLKIIKSVIQRLT